MMLLILHDGMLVSDDRISMMQANGQYGMVWLKEHEAPIEITREALDVIVKQLKLRDGISE